MNCKIIISVSLAMAVYVTVGGVIFWVIESKDQPPAETVNITDVIYTLLGNYTCLEDKQLEGVVSQLQNTLGQYIVEEEELDIHDWIFFAMTVVTTIGYGNLVPKSSLGQTICCVYAVIGVPLCLVLLVNIGSAITEVTSKMEKRISSRYPTTLKSSKTIFLTVLGLVLVLFLPAVAFKYLQGWSYGTAIYFSVISLFTIGFGDYVAGVGYSGEYEALYRIMVGIWLYIGLAWMSVIISSLQDTYSAAVTRVDENLPSPKRPSFIKSNSPKRPSPQIETYRRYDDQEL